MFRKEGAAMLVYTLRPLFLVRQLSLRARKAEVLGIVSTTPRRGRAIVLAVSILALALVQSGASRAVPVLSSVSITVYATHGMGPIHTRPVGPGFRMDAILSLEYADSAAPLDLYLAAILPDGRFASWVGDPKSPSVTVEAVPVPFLKNFTPVDASATYNLTQPLATADPTGWYMLYGIITAPGLIRSTSSSSTAAFRSSSTRPRSNGIARRRACRTRRAPRVEHRPAGDARRAKSDWSSRRRDPYCRARGV